MVKILAVVSGLCCMTPLCFAQASFQGLGFLAGYTQTSTAYGISGDGMTVGGISGNRVCVWRLAKGPTLIPVFPVSPCTTGGCNGNVNALSHDGRTAVGQCNDWNVASDAGFVARDITTITRLTSFSFIAGPDTRQCAADVSADGTVAVGGAGGCAPCRYVGGVAHPIPAVDPEGGWRFGRNATGVSLDGRWVSGYGAQLGEDGSRRYSFRFDSTSGINSALLPLPSPFTDAFALAMSGDGQVVVGAWTGFGAPTTPFRWTETNGCIALPLAENREHGACFGTSKNGNVTVGASGSATSGPGANATVWYFGGAPTDLREALVEAGADVAGWTLTTAYAVSDDGTRVVGVGVNPTGQTEAFLAVLPLPQTCPGDIDDGSGTGKPDGGVDINDLLYFLDHFEAGC